MIFKHFINRNYDQLKSFFRFIISEQLDFVTEATLHLAKERELPLLQFFSHMTPQQLFEYSKASLMEYLEGVVEDKIIESQKAILERWKGNQLDEIPKNDVQISDLVIVSSVRKSVFLNLLPSYTQDLALVIKIALQLDDLHNFIEYLSINTYVEIHQGDLKNLNQNLKEYQEELQVINQELKESHEEIQATNEELREQIEIRHEIEEALEKERNFLRLILENINDGIVACDEYGILSFFNNSTRKLHGVSEKSLPPQHWAKYYNLYHADGSTLMRMEEVPLFRAYNGEKVKDVEMVIATSDGNKKYVLCTGEKIISSDGKTLGAVCVMQDITDKKTSQELEKKLIAQEATTKEAIRQEEIMHLLFQEAPAPVAVLKGEELKFVLLNKQFQDLIFPGRDIVNKPVLVALPEISEEPIYKIIKNVYQTGEKYIGNEVLIQLNNGRGELENRYFNFIYAPTYSAGKHPDGVFIFGYEVTELIKSRNELEASRNKLEKLMEELAMANHELLSANEEVKEKMEDLFTANQKLTRVNNDLDNFIYTASHDLKAPIANIEGLMYALVRNLSDESKIKVEKLIALIENSINRFKHTINDLTDVVKVQKDESQTEILDVCKVISEVKQDLSTLIQKEDVAFDIEACNDVKIVFSYKNFKSIMYNLISNAIKYKSSERKPFVRINSYTEDSFQVVEVTDNGLGIDFNSQTKIFSMFKRLHSHVEGSGIGLYIVKKIVENAGGKIEVESQVNEGSTFKVYFKNTIL